MPKRRLRAAAIAASMLLGVGVLAHLPAARAVFGGCPWGKEISPGRAEELRLKSVATLRASNAAAARPAFGFRLDETTKAEVLAWGSGNGYTCNEEQRGIALRCEQALEGGVRDAFFRFDPRNVLVDVDVMHPGATPARAAEQARAIAAAVARSAGPPTAVRGDASEAHLASGRLSQAATEFRFADYAADIVATNFGDDETGHPKVVVREQYRSLRRN